VVDIQALAAFPLGKKKFKKIAWPLKVGPIDWPETSVTINHPRRAKI
jgi:hypothetical protein